MTCSVAVCPSPKEASYFRFPKDLSIQKIWIDLCKRQDKINPTTARICSAHFKDEDFERDLRNELLNIPVRKLLKKNAIPSQNLQPEYGLLVKWTSPRKRSLPAHREERAIKRARKQLVKFVIILSLHFALKGFIGL